MDEPQTTEVETTEPIEPQVTSGGTDVAIPPDPPAEPKPSRKERRAERSEGYDAAIRDARREAQEARERAQRLEVEMAEFRGKMSANPQANPKEKELEDVEEQLDNVIARLGQGDSSAIKERRTLERKKTLLVAELAGYVPGKDIEERIAKTIPQPMNPQAAALHAEFPQLQTHPHMKDVANGHVARLVALENRDMKDPTVMFATLREAAALAARDLKLGGDKRQAPSERDIGRIVGTSSGDSGAGNGVTTVHLNEHQMALAEQMFRDKTPAEAHVHWWKLIGSKTKK